MLSKYLKRQTITLLLFSMALGLSLTTNAQITCTQFQIDSMVTQINEKDVALKRLDSAHFRAYVHQDGGYYTFEFNKETKQVNSDVSFVQTSYYSKTKERFYSTKPDSNYMIPALNDVCLGVYDGAYEIKGQEKGSFKNGKLNGLVTFTHPSERSWKGTSYYVDGKKNGRDSISSGQWTYIREYTNGRVIRFKVYAKNVLMRHEVREPNYRLFTYDHRGNLQMMFVKDSIHINYENQIKRYSLTYNNQKEIWESHVYYPSGKVERYQAHNIFTYSPISPAVWYDESGKVKAEPEPFFEIEEEMEYVQLNSVMEGVKYVKPNNFLFTFSDINLLLQSIDSSLKIEQIKIKKKYQGNYHLTYLYATSGSEFRYTQYVTGEIASAYIEERLSQVTLDATSFANYPVSYCKASVIVNIKKP